MPAIDHQVDQFIDHFVDKRIIKMFGLFGIGDG